MTSKTEIFSGTLASVATRPCQAALRLDETASSQALQHFRQIASRNPCDVSNLLRCPGFILMREKNDGAHAYSAVCDIKGSSPEKVDIYIHIIVQTDAIGKFDLVLVYFCRFFCMRRTILDNKIHFYGWRRV